MSLCVPCLSRGRESEATRTVGKEPWCELCFVDAAGSSTRCIICNASLRTSNISGFCQACKKSGAAYHKQKELDAKRSAATVSIRHSSLGQKTSRKEVRYSVGV